MLNYNTIKALAIAFVNLLAFLVIFHLLQNTKIYNSTLGKISNNFERIGGWHGEIKDVKKPYIQITNNNLLHWDAAIYDCIRQKMYEQNDESCFALVRPAFFPLFPMVWRFSGLNGIGIGLFNYLIFAASSFWLIRLLANEKRLLLFALGLLLPSVMVFFIPYSEAFFFAAFVLAVYGFLKQKYGLYIFGIIALAMARPAAFFVPMAMLTVITFFFVSGKLSFKNAIREAFLMCAPYAAGLLLVFFIQYYYTGNWLALLEAQKYWSVKLGWPKQIHDWSVEGFGLNSAALFIFVIPALAVIISSFKIKQNKIWIETGFQRKNFLLLTSAAYAVLMFTYVIFFRGGSLHSFFRFTLSSPFFYTFFILMAPKLQSLKLKRKIALCSGLILSIIIYLFLVEYGWGRMNFKFTGLYLFMLFAMFYFIESHISSRAKMLLLTILGLFSLVWSTYLFNMFLSNAWVVT